MPEEVIFINKAVLDQDEAKRGNVSLSVALTDFIKRTTVQSMSTWGTMSCQIF